MDFWRGAPGYNVLGRRSATDAALIANDITGKNQDYLICKQNKPDSITGPFCLTLDYYDEVRGFNWQRIVQDSVYVRGSRDYGNSYNEQGDKKYYNTYVGGNWNTYVEFAPSVRDVTCGPDTGEFSASFTSKVKPNVGEVVVDDSLCTSRINAASKYAPGGEWAISENGVTFTLNTRLEDGYSRTEKYSFLTKNEWKNTGWASEHYGLVPPEWPWYVEVRIKNVEVPNGVKLDGNANSLGNAPWVWGFYYVNWWENLRGVAANGDDFIVRLPCKPPIRCWVPNVEDDWRENPPNSGHYDLWAKKNGEICADVSSLDMNHHGKAQLVVM